MLSDKVTVTFTVTKLTLFLTALGRSFLGQETLRPRQRPRLSQGQQTKLQFVAENHCNFRCYPKIYTYHRHTFLCMCSQFLTGLLEFNTCPQDKTFCKRIFLFKYWLIPVRNIHIGFVPDIPVSTEIHGRSSGCLTLLILSWL